MKIHACDDKGNRICGLRFRGGDPVLTTDYEKVTCKVCEKELKRRGLMVTTDIRTATMEISIEVNHEDPVFCGPCRFGTNDHICELLGRNRIRTASDENGRYDHIRLAECRKKFG